MRILVAEDTPTSQLVIRSMVERLGHQVQVVADGMEAFHAIGSSPFDAVLLDLQMPVMGGLEAARRIRELPAPTGEIYIAALTAQAHAGVHEDILAAGMNGYLVKPLLLDRLDALLVEAGRHADACPSSSAMLGTSIVEAPSISTRAMEELRIALGEEAFPLLLQQFNHDCANALAAMASMLRAKDSAPLRTNAHKLSGLFGQFGWTAAAELAEAVETAPTDVECLARAERLLVVGRDTLAIAVASYLRINDA